MEPENRSSMSLAWLEAKDGTVVMIDRKGESTFGRSPVNKIVLDNDKVSRHHAIIRADAAGGFLLIDVGSRNGTYLNGRKIYRPTLLKDGDSIEVGSSLFRYRENRPEKGTVCDSTPLVPTEPSWTTQECFLAVLDIVGFTELSQTLPSDELAGHVENWVFTCREIIEASSGTINRYLGDAIFAFWKVDDVSDNRVLKAILELMKNRAKVFFEFRVVLHFGIVRFGGPAVAGEDNLLGEDVNFLFRMEKLAGSLKKTFLASEAAVERLKIREEVSYTGKYPIKDYEGKYSFYELMSSE